MECQRCGSKRIVGVMGKCSDRVQLYTGENEHEGSVPDDMGIGGGDYINFDYCLNCGQIHGTFPKPKIAMELELEEV